VDGREVLRRMKSDPKTRIIPVVVLTSSQEERDIAESYKLGVNSYVVKPLDFDKFVEAVSELGLYWVLLNQPPF
jgi:two-component system response regulator